MKPIYLWLLLLTGSTAGAQTCDSSGAMTCNCASKDLSPAGIMFGHEHPKGAWKLSYRYMSMYSSGNLLGTEQVNDNFVFNNYLMSPQSMRMDMHMLMAMYGFTNRLSVMVMLNYNTMTMDMNMLPGTMHMHMDGSTMVMSESTSNSMRSHVSGPGDTKLYAVYSVVNKGVHHVLINAGVSIPTGSIRKKGGDDDMMYTNARYPYMMQTSSGTVDVMPGATYLLKESKFSFSTQVTAVLRPYNNALNYHLGNEFALNAWAAYQWLPWISTSLRAEGCHTGTISGHDAGLYAAMEPSANPINYGGQNLNGYVGLNFYLNKGFLRNNRLSFEYGMPLYQEVKGIQQALRSAVYAGWLISF